MLSTAIPSRHFGRRLARHATIILRNMSSSTTIPSWATYDPYAAGNGGDVYSVPNLVHGKWTHDTKQTMSIIDPMDKNKSPIFTICDTQEDEIQPFIESLRKVPKTGLHNPLKNPERYLQYGDISRKVR